MLEDVMKIPYPGDLNPIDTAVWAAEFVRVRASLACITCLALSGLSLPLSVTLTSR